MREWQKSGLSFFLGVLVKRVNEAWSCRTILNTIRQRGPVKGMLAKEEHQIIKRCGSINIFSLESALATPGGGSAPRSERPTSLIMMVIAWGGSLDILDRYQMGYSLLMLTSWMADRLQLNWLSVGFDDGGFRTLPKLTWVFSDNIKATLGYYYIRGPKTDLIGEFHNNDTIELHWKFSF